MNLKRWLKEKRSILVYSLIFASIYALLTIIGVYYFPLEHLAFFINIPIILLLTLFGLPTLPPESNEVSNITYFLAGIVFYFLIGIIIGYIFQRKKK